MPEEKETFGEWCIVELMGHRRLGGYVTEQEIGGAGLLRIDVPETDRRPKSTHYFRAESLYMMTPTTEEMARAAANASTVEPVSRWELRQLEAPRVEVRDYTHDDDEDYDTDAEPADLQRIPY